MGMRSIRPRLGMGVALSLGLASWGCGQAPSGGGGAPAAPSIPRAPIVSGSRAVVEEYLKAASEADGAKMYALIAASERKSESPKSLQDTAQDRYAPSTSWEVLKTEEGDTAAKVVAEIKGAKVDPNPYTFTLSKEAGEWRIVQSPELHEEDNKVRIKIKL
jgi:hypothetical protein